jgi:uncharacterized protein (TIGR00375 family)
MEEKKRVIADLHVHSRFSRACSKQINLENLEKYAKIKGVDILGTGDFQHPEWSKEVMDLEEKNGLLWSKTGFPFVMQSEVSLMYSQGGRGRRVHYVILVPGKETGKQVTDFLKSKGRLDYDGRPIFGFSSIELVDELIRISPDIEIIPAHCMTPYFGIFGSKSGFDSLKECFEDRESKIHAVESGMSADPEMLRKFSFLNKKAVVSFSDLHSFWPWRIGREATIFNLNSELTYQQILNQIREDSFPATVETEPAYGRYHWDGHRECGFSCGPEKTKELNGICPKCGKKMTIGVENRVEELADQEYLMFLKKPYYKLLPLHELISAVSGIGINSKKTWSIYNSLIEKYSNEFSILLDIDKQEFLKDKIDEKLIKLIMKNRVASLRINPGYDGEYGKLELGEKQEKLF